MNKVTIQINEVTRKPENSLDFIVEYFCGFVNQKLGEVVIKPKL